MINRTHEGSEDGKSHLPGPLFLLRVFVFFRRQPVSEVPPRMIDGSPRRVETAFPRWPPSWLDQKFVGGVPKFAIERGQLDNIETIELADLLGNTH